MADKDGGEATVCTSVCTPVEEDLERRIVEAELSGRTKVADALAKRLEVLRAEQQAGVVDLGEEKARREPRG